VASTLNSQETKLFAAGGPPHGRLPATRPSAPDVGHLEPGDREASCEAAPIRDTDAAVALNPGDHTHLPVRARSGPPPNRFARAQAQADERVVGRPEGSLLGSAGGGQREGGRVTISA
jgi:hypothetical protein